MLDLFTPDPVPGKVHTIHFDGSCRPNPGNMGIGYTIHDPLSRLVREHSADAGQGTNNIAEYLALIGSLKAALALGIRHVRVQGDSQIVVVAVQGRGKGFQKRHPNVQPLLKEAWELVGRFDGFTIAHVPREFNSRADALSTRHQPAPVLMR